MVALIILCNNSYAQESGVSWDFPVKPGSDKWKSLKNSYEKIKICQIPDNILFDLSTDHLIDICLEYPLLLDILAFNNILEGLSKYENDFNGFRELLNRYDAASVLLQKYVVTNPLNFKENWESFEMGDIAMRLSMIELFLSHVRILSKMSHEEKKLLMSEYRIKKEQKSSKKELYHELCIQTIDLGIINLLQSENINLEESIDMESVILYITRGVLLSPNVKVQIDNALLSYLSN